MYTCTRMSISKMVESTRRGSCNTGMECWAPPQPRGHFWYFTSLSAFCTQIWAGQSSSVPSFWLEITKATPEKNRQRKKWCKVSGNKYQQQFYGIIIIIIIIVIIIIIILTEEDAPYASLQQYNSSHGMWNLQLITVMWMSENICKTKVNVDFEGDALGPINTFWFTKDIKAKIAFLRQTVF